jgi:predicted O-methyltransferase YrrM
MSGPPPAPRLDQDWFARLDAAILYGLIRSRPPLRIVEVGSGHSTRFMARAVRDAGAGTEIVCVDPAPRAALAGMPVRHVPELLQAAEPELFRSLAAGDVLFIDSSHVAMPGSDVDLLFNGVLPALRPGVLVHIHDIFLPDPYPAAWAWRGYNEQNAAGGLTQGGRYAIRFASHYLVTRAPDLFARSPLARLPLVPGAFECSLWLEVQG